MLASLLHHFLMFFVHDWFFLFFFAILLSISFYFSVAYSLSFQSYHDYELTILFLFLCPLRISILSFCSDFIFRLKRILWHVQQFSEIKTNILISKNEDVIQRFSFDVWRKTIKFHMCFWNEQQMTCRCCCCCNYYLLWLTCEHLKKISFSFVLQMKRQASLSDSCRPLTIIALRHRLVQQDGINREATTSAHNPFFS